MASRAIAYSACGAMLALGVQKLLRGKNPQVQQERVETQPIDGKAIAAEVRSEIKKYTDDLKRQGVVPGLAVILVGSRKDSQSYVRNKKKAADEVGFHTVDVTLPETVSQEDLLAEVEKLNEDPQVHAILVQLPLPKHIDEALILRTIRVDKDADGFSAENVGNLCLRGGSPPLAVPCTPAGCVELLQRSGVEVGGKTAVVIGRSNIVGMPVSQILQSMDATVTVCHSRTPDMVSCIRKADIVVAAIGKAEYVRGDWLKPGCVVIDVGINAVDDASKKLGYRLVGDVNFAEAQGVASRITPVPGGVGPMTIAMLLKNTLNLARHSMNLPRIPLRRQVSPEESTAAPAARAAAAARGPKLPKGEPLSILINCKEPASFWSAPRAAEQLRKKLQALTEADLPPALLLQACDGPAVSVVSLNSKEVLCSAASCSAALAELSGPQPEASPANGSNGHKLPKSVAVLVGSNGNVWEAAVSASLLREKVKELSGMDMPPPLVMDGAASAVSLLALGKDIAHSDVICTAPAFGEALAALG